MIEIRNIHSAERDNHQETCCHNLTPLDQEEEVQGSATSDYMLSHATAQRK